MNSRIQNKDNKLFEIAGILGEASITMNAQGWSILSKWIREFGDELVLDAVKRMAKSNLQNKNEKWVPYTFGIIKKLCCQGEFKLPEHKRKSDILADILDKEEDD